MKKAWICGVLLLVLPCSVSAGKLYFDMGMDSGIASTETDRSQFKDSKDDFGSHVYETTLGMGLKIGYGPIARWPVYLVLESSGIVQGLIDNGHHVLFNSFLLGPGVVFYPTPLMQVGGSVGYSYAFIQTDLAADLYRSKGGYAWNVYAAADFGKRNHGMLVGLKYSLFTNTLESGVDQQTFLFSGFVKYAYRTKIFQKE